MAGTLSGIKFDDGKGGFSSNCFPVRGYSKQTDDGGAWLVAHTAEQRRRFKAVLCTKPGRTFSQIREERKRAEKSGSNMVPPNPTDADEEEEKPLDGFFLMKHCCVEDPSDLCSVNISGEGLTEVKAEDFALFDNVAYVNASENIIPFDAFRHFPILRELELSLNAIRNIRLENIDFPHLEMLDLSYNNLSSDDILNLGILPNLRVLHLSGNNIKSIPAEMSLPPKRSDTSSEEEEAPKGRYRHLEILLLDDNQISDVNAFASLAGLRRLRHLNLSKNQIYTIPQLMLVEGRHVPTVLGSATSRGRRKHSARKTPRSGRKSRKSERMSPDKPKPTLHLNPSFPTPDPGVKDSASSLDIGELNLDELDKKIAKVVRDTEQFVNPSMSQTSLPLNDVKETIDEEDEMELPSVKEDTFVVPEMNSTRPNAPPFPELVHINLSHNQIKEEESLLAVAAWPLLAELVIHDNPLTTENVGDPPLLRKFLHERLGIRIQRKKTPPVTKPTVEIPVKPERKVNAHVPKVPKQDVEAIIAAIEAPLRRPALPPSTTPSDTPPPPSLDRHTPLPPIPSTPKDIEEINEPEQDLFAGDAFFMTQVDATETKSKSQTPVPVEEVEQKEKKNEKKKKTLNKEEMAKYKGYEELLDIEDEVDEDDEFPNSNDLQGNVRALKYTLEHPLVFRDPYVNLDQQQKPYEPHVKKTTKRPTIKTRTEQTSELLNNMKNRQTVVEEELAAVLKEKHKSKVDFRGADELLGQVQNKYNAVRSTSMNNADAVSKRAKAILKETIDETRNVTEK